MWFSPWQLRQYSQWKQCICTSNNTFPRSCSQTDQAKCQCFRRRCCHLHWPRFNHLTLSLSLTNTFRFIHRFDECNQQISRSITITRRTDTKSNSRLYQHFWTPFEYSSLDWNRCRSKSNSDWLVASLAMLMFHVVDSRSEHTTRCSRWEISGNKTGRIFSSRIQVDYLFIQCCK